MARRPSTRRRAAGRRPSTAQGDILDRDAVDALVDGRRRRRPPRVHHRRAAATRGRRSTSRARATSSRRPRPPAPSGSSTRRRWRPTASTRTTPRAARPRTSRARGTDAPRLLARRRPASRRSSPSALDGIDDRGIRLPPCIVAGPEAPLLDRLDPVHRALRPAARRGARAVRPGPGAQAGAARPRRAVPARAPRRRRRRAARRVARHGRRPASTTSPARARSRWPTSPRDRLVLGADPELAVDATAEIVARLPFLPDEASWIEALRKPVLMDTARARRSCAGSPSTTRRRRCARPSRDTAGPRSGHPARRRVARASSPTQHHAHRRSCGDGTVCSRDPAVRRFSARSNAERRCDAGGRHRP